MHVLFLKKNISRLKDFIFKILKKLTRQLIVIHERFLTVRSMLTLRSKFFRFFSPMKVAGAMLPMLLWLRSIFSSAEREWK